MRRTFSTVLTTLFLILTTCQLFAQRNIHLEESFNTPTTKYEKIGRGITDVKNNTLTTRDAYLCFGENSWADYEIKFKGRVPDTAKQVQLCAGFRAANRDDRYILMLKGGNEKFLYLARLGYMGSDDFLALRELDFHPEPGTWYDFKIQIAGNRIRVYLNNEKLPRIDVVDKLSHLAPAGKVTLGGSWIANEFKELSITSLSKNALLRQPVEEWEPVSVDKVALRKKQRSEYRPIEVKQVAEGRNDISLDGRWLFSPGYEVSDETDATSPSHSDKDWHVMTVPNFWNPLRVWQHGEAYNTASKGVADNYYQKDLDRCEAYTFDYKKTAIGWYRQWLNLPDNIKGKHLELTFDAVSKVAEVWVNGKKAGSHVGMFGDFKLDVSSMLKPGKNLIAVKVIRDYVKDIKDANKIAGVAVTVEVTQKMVKDLAHGFFQDDPAGIWQPVTLTITNPVRIEDVFIKPTLTGAEFNVTVKNNEANQTSFSISTGINGVKFKDDLYNAASLKQLSLKAGETKTFTYNIDGLKPKLWSPDYPNLYDFKFDLANNDGKQIDEKIIRSGFRTFKVDGDYFYLNGKRYWLRGGNQTAAPLVPNDTAMAHKFNQLMRQGNIMVTRTHTVPYNEIWMNASDEDGIGVSYEGTWPWLFLESSMPAPELVNLWKNEFYDLIKKYRNHPSLLIWTMNNEMKFYDNDPDDERAKIKMKTISDVVKTMRTIDPSRPIVFDSNYRRNTKRFGADFYKDIDDGDIDDPHAYYNWYDYSMFKFFKGEWQKNNKNDGRPLISQEMSTGYTDETGHPTRYYTYVHQNPASLVGKFAYEYNDPKYYLTTQAFISKELGEALRRTDDRSAGILHFSTLTWFANVDMVNEIKPWPVYYEMKKALQPVLVTAEFWGRHFYAGAKLPTQICIVNDKEDGTAVGPSTLKWELVGNDNHQIATGELPIPTVEHYGRKWIDPQITIPVNLPQNRVDSKLLLTLIENGKKVSENSYDLLLMNKNDLNADVLNNKKILVLDKNKGINEALSFLGVKYTSANTVADLQQKADVYILSGLNSLNTNTAETAQIKTLLASGKHVLLSGCGNFVHTLYPEYIRSIVKEDGEVTNMEIPESPIYNGLEPLDLRNFNNNERELPSVMAGAFRINRNENVVQLASFTKVHGYLPGDVNERMSRLDKIKGFPIVKIGNVILSQMRLDKTLTDPVAGKLLINMLTDLAQ
ncbi:glycoside hydrolase family 2 protein [Mucilaginibacter jinjuensis]|uniref:beta-galactosidase n=1 Tax=Mucilaginibacter jinjuensis TaxID=1176721 RepID=A0ABY7T2F6_9SPHI|nr:sugar-binding domain-containing protein [Mucilaginibacter jinjuensis]WCT10429.1 glycoside hydrolase family 2 TIM barrel-domain containing protein [Mucilaginibacter jinjuensis]